MIHLTPHSTPTPRAGQPRTLSINMDPISAERLTALKNDLNAPTDYIQWIQAHGWGSVSNSHYMLYDGLVALEEIVPGATSGYFAFGDDMAGCNGCFSAAGDGLVYEYVADVGDVHPTGKRFAEFIKTYA